LKDCPVDEILPDLKRALKAHHSAVLHAPPGAGKTTRVPLALLDIITSEKEKIVMLEPRRIAAVSAARWMAQLLGEDVGDTVGYSIRFDSRLSSKTRIEVVTEGILTRRIQRDPGLEGVSLVIFDEFHTRSIHTDLALALCLDIRKTLRDDLNVLVMSATLDCASVASLLGDAPVISSGGRQYHVEERYIEEKQEGPVAARITQAVRTALRETEGDILVFLPGSGEIRACADALLPLVEGKDSLSLHPLFGDLPFEEQERAILPSDRRKIVLATNIAETSLTIKGIGVVIDSGLARSLRHDPSRAMNRLVTVTISRASAEQRKGRAGRLGPGMCYRLYSRGTFRSMVAFAPPEILVSDLSSLVLDLAVWGVKDPSMLSWMDAPPPAAWETARSLLFDLNALDSTGDVTRAGRAMSLFPLHPRLGCLMLRAGDLGIAATGADLAALLSERDVLRRISTGFHERLEADIAVRLDILREWRNGKKVPDYADPWALRSVDRTAKQLLRLMLPEKELPATDPEREAVGRLLLTAFPDRLGRSRDEGDGRFVLSQGRGVKLAAKSALGRSRFVVAVNMDAGEKSEGVVHIGVEVSEELIRQEYEGRIETVKRIEWDERQGRIAATKKERIGAVTLSVKPFVPSDEETIPVLCDVLRSSPRLLVFGEDERQFQCRVLLMKRTFPEEGWPDLSDESLAATPEKWLAPFLGNVRTVQNIARLDLMPALRALLSREQRRLLDERAPALIAVPSGRRAALDYLVGETPVLAVKLQEMFGMAETPVIAGGSVKILLHLLSPAGRPVQITQDLKGFWDKGYQQVKKELRGRYPKHPWPDNPWSAVPTRGTRKKKDSR
jgi:ATP-dependent helicase HrpB